MFKIKKINKKIQNFAKMENDKLPYLLCLE